MRFVRYEGSMNREDPMAITTRKPAAPRKSGAGKATTTKSKSSAKKSGANWGTAAIVGGVAVVGAAAAAAALLALRGSTPVDPDAVFDPDEKPRQAKRKADRADGSDTSAFFKAGVADEGTISR